MTLPASTSVSSLLIPLAMSVSGKVYLCPNTQLCCSHFFFSISGAFNSALISNSPWTQTYIQIVLSGVLEGPWSQTYHFPQIHTHCRISITHMITPCSAIHSTPTVVLLNISAALDNQEVSAGPPALISESNSVFSPKLASWLQSRYVCEPVGSFLPEHSWVWPLE